MDTDAAGNGAEQQQAPEPAKAPESQSSGQSGGQQTNVKGLVEQLEALLDEYLVRKAPFTLPMNVKEIIVKISPYLAIVCAIFAVPAVFALLGFSAIVAPIAFLGGFGNWGLFSFVSLITTIITLVLEVSAVSGLFKRTHKAWRLIFYATLVGLIGSIFSWAALQGILGTIIGWYFLFQVKELYKN